MERHVNSPAVVVGGFEYIVETVSKTISYKKKIDKKQKFTIFLHFFFFTIPHSFPMGVIFDQRPQV